MFHSTSVPLVPRSRPGFAAGLAAGLVLLAAGLPCRAQQAGPFRQGACSGLLCDYIGGSQAPAAQGQKSLFRQGECGGVLCDAIGGPQAPKRSDPPPNCGGGLLCDVMPYRMGASLSGAGSMRRLNEADDRQAAAPIAPPASAEVPHRRARKIKRKVARAAE